jgi:hypothetical protein
MSEIKSTNKYLIKRKYKTIDGNTYPMDEYQVILVEEDSEDCGYIRPQYQWSATTGYICDFETYTKYSREVKMVSYDSGVTWSVSQPIEERKSDVIAYDSYDCGKPMYRCVETDEAYCEDNGDDFAASFYRNNEDTPRVTIECTNSIIDGQDKDYFGSTDWYSKIAASSITQVNIGECVIEFKKFNWSFNNALLTVGNNVRIFDDVAISTGRFPKHSNFARPIVLPKATKKILETQENGVDCYIEPLVEPNVDEFVITRTLSSPTIIGRYNIVAPYGTKYDWEQLKSIEKISGGTVVQEHYETPNENWKAKITFKGYYNYGGSSTYTQIENERTLYLADDPTHTLGANELNNMSNLLAGGGTNAGDYRWESDSSIKNGFRYTNGSYNYDIYAIKEIEINGSVSAITSGAISGFSRYSAGSYITDRVGYPSALNIKLNEGLLVFGDKFNIGISANDTYYNYQIEFPSSLTAITSYSICLNPQTYNGVTYGYTLKFTSVIPPTIQYNGALNNVVKILVPCGSLNRYLTEWSQYADKIEPYTYECLPTKYEDEGFVCINQKVWKTQRLYYYYNNEWNPSLEVEPYEETDASCANFDFVEYVDYTVASNIPNRFSLGINFTNSTVLELEFIPRNAGGRRWLWDSNGTSRFFRSSSVLYYDLFGGRINSNISSFTSDNGKLKIALGNYYMKDLPTDQVITSGTPMTVSDNINLCVGKDGGTWDFIAWYRITAKEGNTVTKDLIPIRRTSDSVYGFFDAVGMTALFPS